MGMGSAHHSLLTPHSKMLAFIDNKGAYMV